MSELEGLSFETLSALASSLESGRLAPPFTSTSLSRFVHGGAAPGIASELQQQADKGASPEVLSWAVKCLAAARRDRKHLHESVDLVWTGPEERGTASRDTAVVVKELFSRATTSVLVAGFAVYRGRDVFAALAKRMEELPSLKVDMYLNISRQRNDTSLSEDIVRRFLSSFRSKDWPGEKLPSIYYDPRSLSQDWTKRASLHAKCVVVDRRWSFVSSANFTEAAQERNIEAGVLIDSPPFADSLSRQFESLVTSGTLESFR